MSDITKYELPTSVMDYLCDRVVQTAVDSLLDFAEDVIPPFIEQNELANYYRARAAALAVKYDTIIALEGLWRAVWGELLINWRLEVGNQKALDPETIWEDRDFWVQHKTLGFSF